MQDSILYNISSVATWRRSWNLERWRLRPWYGSRRPEVRPRDSTILLGKDGKRWWTCDFVHSFFFKKKYGYESKPWYLVNPKIAGKWMFIPLKMVLIGIDPYPYIYIYIGSRLIAWFIFYSIFIGVVFRQVVIRWAAGRLSPWLPFWSGFFSINEGFTNFPGLLMVQPIWLADLSVKPSSFHETQNCL